MRILRDRRVRAIALIVSVAAVAGCASAKFIPTREVSPAKPENCAMEVFTSKAPDFSRYRELGLTNAMETVIICHTHLICEV